MLPRSVPAEKRHCGDPVQTIRAGGLFVSLIATLPWTDGENNYGFVYAAFLRS
jgi:hypothetical protein